MAIDDVISDYETSVANNAKLSIQAASGDEWLITHIFVEGTFKLVLTVNAETVDFGPMGANTAETEDWSLGGGGQGAQALLVSNSDFPRMSNKSGGTKSLGFSAIKTKD